MKTTFFLICFAFAKAVIAQSPTPSQDAINAFKAETIMHKGKEFPYRILMPKDFDSTKKYPLHIFLHGAGERGNDNRSQLTHGADLFLEKSKKYPAIVIFPQCPKDDYWADVSIDRTPPLNVFTFPENPKPTWAMEALLHLIDTQLDKPYVRKEQVYAGGLSMGGMGTFELLNHRPHTFAAATAICGAGNPSLVNSWAQNTPIWIFHGNQDPVVPIIYSQIIVEALLKNGVEPRVSFYPLVQHDSWTQAFAEPDFFSWIYNHSKKVKEVVKTSIENTPEWLKFTEEALIERFKSQNEALNRDTSRIVFMGDSITEGWLEASPDFWTSHPHYVNRGVGGQTTSQMLLRFRQDVIALAPKRVFILAGTNDIAGNTGKISIQNIAYNLYTMADLAKKHNIEVTFASVLPVFDYPWKPGLQPAEKITKLNHLLQEYATLEGHQFIDFHNAMKNESNGMKTSLSYDGVHCNKAGYEMMEAILKQNWN